MATDILSHKTCSACKECKPIALFGKASGYADGHRGQCTPCRGRRHSAYLASLPASAVKRKATPSATRRTKIKQRYGMTEADYTRLLDSQGSGCAVCGNKEAGGRWKVFHIDHCHQTGEVRGLLCHRCNVTLGSMGDTIEGVMRFVVYLQAKGAKVLTLV